MPDQTVGSTVRLHPFSGTLAGRCLAVLDRRVGGIPLPGWATPLAIASLAMWIVQSYDHRFARASVPWTLLIVGALAVLFAALYAAVAFSDQRLAPIRQRPLTAILLFILAANTLIHVVMLVPHLADHQRYGVDAAAATDCATQQILQGQNPYHNVHMLTCLNSHGLAFNQTTPKRAGKFWNFWTFPTPNQPESGVGSQTFENMEWQAYWKDLAREEHDPHYAAAEFETRFNYPGGALLFSLAAWTFGTRDLVGLLLLCALAASILIYQRAPSRLRWATGMVLLADAPLLLDSSVGATDALYALLLVIYWQLRDRPIMAGLVLGLAAATRQQVWFFLPFLLYLGWRTGGWPDLRRRGWSALAVFVACNLPFIVIGPGDWVAGVLGPMSDPLFAQGIGLIALAIAFSNQHLGPPIMYTALELLALASLFRLFMRRCMTSPGLAMLLPLLPLALAWRSLHTYFVVLPLLMTAVLACPKWRGAARGTLSEAGLHEAA